MRLATRWLMLLVPVALLAAPGWVFSVGAYDAVQVTDGGTIQGKVTFPGSSTSQEEDHPDQGPRGLRELAP